MKFEDEISSAPTKCHKKPVKKHNQKVVKRALLDSNCDEIENSDASNLDQLDR